MVVHLTPELEDLVREKVETGRYQSENDVVAQALRLLDERDRRAALEAALDEGEADLREGRFVEVADAAELKALFSDL
jgi:antitoxin ParD1/3/4